MQGKNFVVSIQNIACFCICTITDKADKAVFFLKKESSCDQSCGLLLTFNVDIKEPYSFACNLHSIPPGRGTLF